jgi:hypothetical protein
MVKSDFQPDTRYTLVLRDAAGKLRPCIVYVFRVYDAFMIARPAGSDALLHKIALSNVVRIVAAHPVAPPERYMVPAALLDEKMWREREVMSHYASSPARGK